MSGLPNVLRDSMEHDLRQLLIGNLIVYPQGNLVELTVLNISERLVPLIDMQVLKKLRDHGVPLVLALLHEDLFSVDQSPDDLDKLVMHDTVKTALLIRVLQSIVQMEDELRTQLIVS